MKVYEAELALKLGIKRLELAKIRRKLPRGTHWDRAENAAIVWLDEGIPFLKQCFNIPDDEPLIAPEPFRPRTEEVTITHKYRNARLMDGKLDDGEEVRLVVRNNYFYRPGQKILARSRVDNTWGEIKRPRYGRGKLRAAPQTN